MNSEISTLGRLTLHLYAFFIEVDVPVVGGHAGITILPLFSQVVSSTDIHLFHRLYLLCGAT